MREFYRTVKPSRAVETSVREVVVRAGSVELLARSSNPAYKPIPYPASGVTITGLVRWIHKDVRNRTR